MQAKKAIMIKDCLDCPLAGYNSSNIVVCESARWINRKPVAHIKKVAKEHLIPDWCPLPDVRTIFAESDVEAKEALINSEEGLEIVDKENQEIRETEEITDNYLKSMRKRQKVNAKTS